jgi:hypothetical protein
MLVITENVLAGAAKKMMMMIIIIIIMVKINKETPDERFRGLARGYY